MRNFLALLALVLLCGCTAKPMTVTLPKPVDIPQVQLEEEKTQAQIPQETLPTKETHPTVETPKAETVEIAISCAALLQNPEVIDEAKRELLPPSGFLLPPCEVDIREGESVFDLLFRLCREHGILMEFTMSPVYESAYIEGIGNLYEFDGGPQSGWVYTVNGVSPNVGCSSYDLKAGDVVVWEYTIQ